MFEALERRVIECIRMKQEGESWDFKREWHKKKSDLLHDIICMANLPGEEDGIIIIGCDEESDYQLRDVSNDPDRKNTSQLVVFLRDKKFSQGIRPTVLVHSMKIDETVIDIILVKSSRNTPFYLTERFEAVNPHHIYSRVMDTNTPIDKSADPDRIEKLWRKRFAIDSSPSEKLISYLQSPGDWISIDGAQSYYYRYAPEYTVRTESDDRDGYEYYMFGQVDTRPIWYEIKVYYHQTLIESILGNYIDGTRYFTPAPENTLFYDSNHQAIFFGSFTRGTLHYALHRFFYEKEYSIVGKEAHDIMSNSVLFFSSNDEKEDFLAFATSNYPPSEIDPMLTMPSFPEKLSNRQDPVFFQRKYKQALEVQTLLLQYRSQA